MCAKHPGENLRFEDLAGDLQIARSAGWLAIADVSELEARPQLKL